MIETLTLMNPAAVLIGRLEGPGGLNASPVCPIADGQT